MSDTAKYSGLFPRILLDHSAKRCRAVIPFIKQDDNTIKYMANLDCGYCLLDTPEQDELFYDIEYRLPGEREYTKKPGLNGKNTVNALGFSVIEDTAIVNIADGTIIFTSTGTTADSFFSALKNYNATQLDSSGDPVAGEEATGYTGDFISSILRGSLGRTSLGSSSKDVADTVAGCYLYATVSENAYEWDDDGNPTKFGYSVHEGYIRYGMSSAYPKNGQVSVFGKYGPFIPWSRYESSHKPMPGDHDYGAVYMAIHKKKDDLLFGSVASWVGEFAFMNSILIATPRSVGDVSSVNLSRSVCENMHSEILCIGPDEEFVFFKKCGILSRDHEVVVARKDAIESAILHYCSYDSNTNRVVFSVDDGWIDQEQAVDPDFIHTKLSAASFTAMYGHSRILLQASDGRFFISSGSHGKFVEARAATENQISVLSWSRLMLGRDKEDSSTVPAIVRNIYTDNTDGHTLYFNRTKKVCEERDSSGKVVSISPYDPVNLPYSAPVYGAKTPEEFGDDSWKELLDSPVKRNKEKDFMRFFEKKEGKLYTGNVFNVRSIGLVIAHDAKESEVSRNSNSICFLRLESVDSTYAALATEDTYKPPFTIAAAPTVSIGDGNAVRYNFPYSNNTENLTYSGQSGVLSSSNVVYRPDGFLGPGIYFGFQCDTSPGCLTYASDGTRLRNMWNGYRSADTCGLLSSGKQFYRMITGSYATIKEDYPEVRTDILTKDRAWIVKNDNAVEFHIGFSAGDTYEEYYDYSEYCVFFKEIAAKGSDGGVYFKRKWQTTGAQSWWGADIAGGKNDYLFCGGEPILTGSVCGYSFSIHDWTRRFKGGTDDHDLIKNLDTKNSIYVQIPDHPIFTDRYSFQLYETDVMENGLEVSVLVRAKYLGTVYAKRKNSSYTFKYDVYTVPGLRLGAASEDPVILISTGTRTVDGVKVLSISKLIKVAGAADTVNEYRISLTSTNAYAATLTIRASKDSNGNIFIKYKKYVTENEPGKRKGLSFAYFDGFANCIASDVFESCESSVTMTFAGEVYKLAPSLINFTVSPSLGWMHTQTFKQLVGKDAADSTLPDRLYDVANKSIFIRDVANFDTVYYSDSGAFKSAFALEQDLTEFLGARRFSISVLRYVIGKIQEVLARPLKIVVDDYTYEKVLDYFYVCPQYKYPGHAFKYKNLWTSGYYDATIPVLTTWFSPGYDLSGWCRAAEKVYEFGQKITDRVMNSRVGLEGTNSRRRDDETGMYYVGPTIGSGEVPAGAEYHYVTQNTGTIFEECSEAGGTCHPCFSNELPVVTIVAVDNPLSPNKIQVDIEKTIKGSCTCSSFHYPEPVPYEHVATEKDLMPADGAIVLSGALAKYSLEA